VQSWPALKNAASTMPRGPVEVGVGEHERRRFAAEFEVHALEVPRGRGGDLHTRAPSR
jgi:hypothetical protein